MYLRFLERWQSGLMRLTRNQVYSEGYRGFKSPPLRLTFFELQPAGRLAFLEFSPDWPAFFSGICSLAFKKIDEFKWIKSIIMYYVYLIRSINFPEKTYVGVTDDLKNRLKTHNAGGSLHTIKFKPWTIVVYMGFNDKSRAIQFEKYLKSLVQVVLFPKNVFGKLQKSKPLHPFYFNFINRCVFPGIKKIS